MFNHGVQALESTGAEMGMLLVDSSLQIIAFDRGAAAILNDAGRRSGMPQAGLCIPQVILEVVRNCPPEDLSSLQFHFRTGMGDYTCRAYLMESHYDPKRRTIMALHLERSESGPDMLDALGLEYHLTGREQQALRGIAAGLTTKELADKMSISPNTVKAFLRLIMIKMGVSTRAGITARLLERNGRTRSVMAMAAGVQVPTE
jgi:DNA-binding CsgD family transcriptional regulator